MNIFYLAADHDTCCQYHVDKHVVKMILEYAQLLSTAHHVLDGEHSPLTQHIYKPTHINHPSAVWVRQSDANYHWLADLLAVLCGEYTHRYSKYHKVEASGLAEVLGNYLPHNIPSGAFTEPTPAMPEEYKIPGDSIASYRQYYSNAKRNLFSWRNRPVPEWVVL